jgi:predicted SAM-dependent methyltransferase
MTEDSERTIGSTELDRCLSRPDRHSAYLQAGGRAKRLARGLVPHSLRPLVVMLATRALMPLQRRRVKRVLRTEHSPIHLHLGSGTLPKPGWVNIDLVGQPADLYWDLRVPLPLAPSTVQAIFHEHLLEHLFLGDGIKVLHECHRLLKPGGVLRLGVPDAEAYVKGYLEEGNDFLKRVRVHGPTKLLAMQRIFYEHGHRTMYDFETLRLLLEYVGFRQVERSTFRGSRYLKPCPDSIERREETLYVEGLR